MQSMRQPQNQPLSRKQALPLCKFERRFPAGTTELCFNEAKFRGKPESVFLLLAILGHLLLHR
jgi:hypothetical protein